jgi:hypothetical protein
MPKQKTKLIRNLKPGDIIQISDATRIPPVVARVRIRSVAEIDAGFITGRRRWIAHFDWIKPPDVYTAFNSFMSITGYSTDRIEVYND